MKSYLAIDIGASGGRHILGFLKDNRLQTKEIYRFENKMVEKNGHLCWDEESLWAHILSGIKAAKPYAPVSIGIDTWGVDFALLNAKGQIVGDLIAYRDDRTQGMDTFFDEKLPFTELFRLTGIARQPFNTLYQMMAVLKEHPSYREDVKDFLMMPEYLSYRLTGKKLHEKSELSTSALLDAQTGDWAEEVLAKADLPKNWFQTPIVPSGTRLGALLPSIAQEVGFQTQVLLPATHDTGSAYMAVPAKDENAVFLSSGTWSLLGTELSTPITNKESLQSGFTNESGWNNCIRYLKNIMGMWMLQCLRKETNNRYSYQEMAQMAAESTYEASIDATNNRFLSPESMLKEVKASLQEQGAKPPQNLSDIFRAVTLGLALCYRDSIRELSYLTHRTFTSLNIVGGGSQNETLNQLTADLTGLPVYTGPTEGTALGNLGAQFLAEGEIKNLRAFREILKESCEVITYLPGGKERKPCPLQP